MSEHDELSVERSADLDLGVDELWNLVSTADGWSTWLVDETDVTIRPDATGTATNDGVERSVRIDSVVDNRSVRFAWWDRDDPSAGSFVQLDIVELPGGRSHLDITERSIDGGATATASMSCSIAVRWDIALVSLWLLSLPSFVMA